MTRDEVIERLDCMAEEANIDLARFESVGHWPAAVEKRKQEQALRAAAELIRQSGWRPIAEAPDGEWLFVGKPTLTGWFPFSANKAGAIANGYTHYLPMPEPPAREVPLDPGPKNPIP